MIKPRIEDLTKRPGFNVGDILKLIVYKMSLRKHLKLNGTRETHPTAWK